MHPPPYLRNGRWVRLLNGLHQLIARFYASTFIDESRKGDFLRSSFVKGCGHVPFSFTYYTGLSRLPCLLQEYSSPCPMS